MDGFLCDKINKNVYIWMSIIPENKLFILIRFCLDVYIATSILTWTGWFIPSGDVQIIDGAYTVPINILKA